MRSDDFYRRRAEWLSHIAANAAVHDGAFRVAFVIARHIDAEAGAARPSPPQVAECAAVSIHTVRRAVIQLEQLGCIKVTAGVRSLRL